MATNTSPSAPNAEEEHVVELVIRVPDAASARWVADQVRAMLPNELGAYLENFGIFPASVFDAPGAEVVGVPA